MDNKISEGRIINYVAKSDVSGGDVVAFPGFIAVAATDIPKGGLGALAVEGVYDLPKSSGAISQGDPLFLDESGKLASSGSVFAGVAWADAAANAPVATCRINFGAAPAPAPDTPPQQPGD